MDGDISISPTILKSLACCSCRKIFSRRNNQEHRSKGPYLLSCGHSICEYCCQNVTTNIISCGDCRFPTQLSSVNNVTSSLPRNAYLEGRLCLTKSLRIMDNISYKIAMKENKNMSEKNTDINCLEQTLTFCYECSQANATKTCQQCECNFCDPCWTKVHSSGKSLQKHVSLPNNSFTWNNIEYCKDHEGKVLEFFCRECRIYACPTCIVLNHQGGNHKPVTLQERNLELFEDIESAKKEVNMNMKRMIDTVMEVKALRDKVPCREESYENLQRQIVHSFVHLHGILQVAEESVLKRLDVAETVKRDRLEEILLQLERQIKTVKVVVEGVDNLKEVQKDVVLEKVLDTLTSLKKLPSRLVRSDEPWKEKPTVSFDESVIERLQNYCTLNIPTSSTFELESDGTGNVFHFSEQTTREDVSCRQQLLKENLGNGIKPKKPDCSNDSKRLIHNTYTIRSLNLPLSVSPMPKTQPLSFVEGNAYPVCISYVKDPGEFYVIRSSLRKRRQKIDAVAPTLAARVHTPPKNIQKDEYYLVQYTADKKWYRGRVVDALPRKNENNETVAVIYYLDYGNKQEVPLSRMRDMPKALREEPPLAIKCRLFSCVPRNGIWCKGATKVMLDVLDTSVMTMYVMKVLPDCLEVDLSRGGNEESLDHELISLRDMMVFLEYASIATRYDDTKKNRNDLRYLTPAVPNAGDTFLGLITYVESDSLFYVQKIGPDAQYFLTLMDKLDNTYNKGNMKGLIYNPDLDMPCAALYHEDGKWYRGEIIDFPGHEQLTVHYVDYGNKETVHWKSVRRLHHDFLKLVPQAIPCTLMEVPLPVKTRWRRDVKVRLESYSSEILRVAVIGRKAGKLNVLLYTNKNSCVNEEMIENDTGEQNRSSVKLRSVTVTEDGKHEKCRKGRKKEVPADEESSNSSDEVFRTEVKILQASSPSDIYVSLLCFLSRAEELEKEMQEFYGKSELENDAKWKKDDRCAALSCKRQKWYRATIEEILDDKMKVLFKDIMEMEDVPVSNIRVLDDRFFSYPIGAIKCHLSGIFPPETEWPGLTCDFLKSQLNSYKHVYMTKMGEIDNNSLPIQLWVKKRMQGGALEPTTEEWLVLNDLIVQQGLAVPEKAKLLHHIVDEEEAKEEDRAARKKVKFVEDIPLDVLAEADDSFIPSVACDWPPPEICVKDHFIGEPTYVDQDGVIYIQDEEDKPTLDHMRASLLDYYEDSKPQAHDQYWSEGQLCIVKYHIDGGWYRGKVLKVNEDFTYRVLFVDYGNEETCRIMEMRKDVKHLDVPTLTRKCVLHGVLPVAEDGRWPIQVTDYMHSSLVEKRCDITIMKKSGDVLKVNIKVCEEGFDIGEHLVTIGLAKFDSVDKSGESSVSQVSQVPVRDLYSKLVLPKDFKTFPIEVLIVKFSEFFVHILDHESIPADVRKVISDFVVLTDEIQRVADSQEEVVDFREGVPCISLYSENGTWYRAEILRHDVDRNLVLVRYVDYGNEEYVTKDRIRKCLTKWFNVPKMVLNLKLNNVRMCTGVNKSVYLESLTKCLAQPGLTAEVIQDNENVYLVEVKRDGVLAYQELLDGGLLELVLPTDRSYQFVRNI